MEADFRSDYRIKMMFITLMLFILLSLCSVVHSQCNGLTIFNGSGINVTSECIKSFPAEDCLPFYNSFNQSDLPQDYPKSAPNSGVEKPSAVSLDGLTSPYNDLLYPGLSIRWNPPFSDSARINCYGYLVVWFYEGSNTTRCQLFHVNTTSSRQTVYRYNVQYVVQASDYTVRVYSMPPNELKDKNEQQSFVATDVMRTFVAYKGGLPGNWVPFVSYAVLKNGTINASFTLPPADFNITHFTVHLKNKNNMGTPVSTVRYNPELRTQENTQFFFSISATESGLYNIVVWADDDLRMIDGLCKCWIIQNDVRTCKNSCSGTETSYFYVNITSLPSPQPSSTTSSTSLSTSSTSSSTTSTSSSTSSSSISSPQSSSSSTSTTQTAATTGSTTGSSSSSSPDSNVGIIVGVVVPVVVVIIILVLYLLRKRLSVKNDILGWLHKPEHKPPVIPKPEPFPFHPKEVVSLPKKTVYILYADDHEAHEELVKAFAIFLQVHCSCNVILPSDSDQRDKGAFEWVLNSVNRSDYIIFINSEGAEKLIDAHLNGKTYKNRVVGPEGDLFIYGLRHILVSEDIREQTLILVSFSGIHCRKYLQVPKTYMLPMHLSHLLKKIHKLNADGVRIYNNVLPMNVENIPELPTGAELLAAIKNAKIYQKDNPTWFESRFGDLKSPFYRLKSDDSGKPPSLMCDSVSQQFRDPDSPSSDSRILQYPTHPELGLLEPSAPPICDDLSCFTIDNHERTVATVKPELRQQTGSAFDGYSIIPPETISKIYCDNYSEALADINRNNAETYFQHPHYSPINNNTDNYADDDHRGMEFPDNYQTVVIIPPDDPSDIQVDSVSCALAAVNTDADSFLFKRTEGHLLLHKTVNGDVQSDFDSFSI